MKIFFHVGLPRAASTFLQYKVFPFFKDVQYIKKHHFKKSDQLITSSNAPSVLLSSEMDIGKENRYDRLIEIAGKYPEAQTILVLRKHRSWIKSKYYYHIRKHGYLDFDEFFNFENTGFFKTEHLIFFKKIEIIKNLYIKDPYIIFQEEISDDPFGVIDALAALMKTKYNRNDIRIDNVNQSFSNDQLRRLLHFNKKLRNWPEKVLAFNFFYRAFRNFLIRLIVVYSTLASKKSPYLQPLIPEEKLAEIDRYFENDWKQCTDFAEKNNPSLINSFESQP